MIAPRRLIALPLLLVAACAVLGPPQAPERGLAPPEAMPEQSFQQVLTVQFDSTERRLIAAGQIHDGVLVLALLSPEGMEVLRLRQTRAGVEVLHEAGLPPGLTPRAILADFQLVHWPVDALRRALGEAWTLDAGAGHRELYRNGDARIRVEYTDGPWQGPATLSHRQYGYRLYVKTLSHELRDTTTGAAAPQ